MATETSYITSSHLSFFYKTRFLAVVFLGILLASKTCYSEDIPINNEKAYEMAAISELSTLLRDKVIPELNSIKNGQVTINKNANDLSTRVALVESKLSSKLEMLENALSTKIVEDHEKLRLNIEGGLGHNVENLARETSNLGSKVTIILGTIGAFFLFVAYFFCQQWVPSVIKISRIGDIERKITDIGTKTSNIEEKGCKWKTGGNHHND